MCEESKVDENYESQLLVNELKQCEYLMLKRIPIDNVITLGPSSLIIKNQSRIGCIRLIENNLNCVFIENGRKLDSKNYEMYNDIVDDVIKWVFCLSKKNF
tara:strand:+ start:58 stop:360 length:303 start_codon:yes stop_codon:yes gene_type:complete